MNDQVRPARPETYFAARKATPILGLVSHRILGMLLNSGELKALSLSHVTAHIVTLRQNCPALHTQSMVHSIK
jgi:hypothetical protein